MNQTTASTTEIDTEPSTNTVYLIERRDQHGNTLNNVDLCSTLELVETAIETYLKDGLEPSDDVGHWYFCVLEWAIDEFSPTSGRAVQLRDRHNKEVEALAVQTERPTVLTNLTAALEQALQQLSVHEECNLPLLFQGWSALAKATGQPIAGFWEQRDLERAPSLLDCIGMNEWEWACSIDLPTGYATRVAVTQNTRDNIPSYLWWTIALVSPEGEHDAFSFTVSTVGGEDVTRIVNIIEAAVCHEGYDVFEGTEAEWQTYLRAVELQTYVAKIELQSHEQ